MKTIAAALFALAVLAGVAAPASADDDFNPNTFFQDLERKNPV